MLPAEAGLKRVYFDGAICECTIVCEDPGVAEVGPKGATVRAIRDEIGWIVRTERFAAVESRTMHNIRKYRQESAEDQRLCYASLALEFYCPQRSGEPWCETHRLGFIPGSGP